MARAPEPLTDIDALAQLSFIVQQKLQRHAGARDLSVVQTRLLGVLRDRRPTMKEIGTLLNLDKSSVSGLVERAEQRGLVLREPDSTDRRATRVSLSETGRAIAAELTTKFTADMTEMLAPLSMTQRTTLTHLVGQILPSP